MVKTPDDSLRVALVVVILRVNRIRAHKVATRYVNSCEHGVVVPIGGSGAELPDRPNTDNGDKGTRAKVIRLMRVL